MLNVAAPQTYVSIFLRAHKILHQQIHIKSTPSVMRILLPFSFIVFGLLISAPETHGQPVHEDDVGVEGWAMDMDMDIPRTPLCPR